MVDEIKVEGNGHNPDSPIVKEKKKILRASSAAGAMHSPAGSGSPSDHLVVAGDDPRALLMRTIYADKKREGNIMSIVTARDLADCEEFDDELDMEELKDIIAGDTSVGGQARRELVQCITGDLNMKNQRSFSQWFKGAFNNGNQEKPKE